MKGKLVIWLIIVLILGVIFASYKSTQKSTAKSSKEHTVAVSNFKNILKLTGFVDAKEKVFMTFATGGKLSWVGVKEGDIVHKWQGIASIDSRTLSKQADKFLNNYDITRRSFDQTVQDQQAIIPKTTEGGNTQKWTIEKSQYTLNNSVLDVEIARIAEENTYLSTPIDGTVTKVDAPYSGIYISPNQGYEVINFDSLFFNAKAEQTEVVDLHNNMMAEITFDALPNKTFPAVVQYVGLKPRLGETSTLYDVQLTFDKSQLGAMLKLGMTGDVSFILSQRDNIIAIPLNFIKTDTVTKEKYTYKLENKKRVKTILNTGETNDGNVEILSGLKVGDKVYDSP